MTKPTNPLELKFVNQANKIYSVYLRLDQQTNLPLVLGTGRNAVVFLATTVDDVENPGNDYRAVKFLRDDVDKQYARAAADRFFQEAEKASHFDLIQETFVQYYGWGAVGQPGSDIDLSTGEWRDFWWKAQFRDYTETIVNHNDDFSRIKLHFNLQGPFYIIRLCQGTLHDLLDKAVTWSELPAYSIERFYIALSEQANEVKEDMDDVVTKYLERSPAELSGYDILNAFKADKASNRVRSYAVLDLFKQVAFTVSKLHIGMRNIGPLAHRDLKPGNTFLMHGATASGFRQIETRLADLGYVVNPEQLEGGEKTMIGQLKGVEYAAPGSQFYRAPEQIALPIEVRLDIDADDPTIVHVRGSKIADIQVHDWLTLNDLFSDDDHAQAQQAGEQSGLFKIMHVSPPSSANPSFRLQLDFAAKTSRTTDLQAQINRATGFHTDGFSLGAILYDMISGGKDPEMFYTYCLFSFTSQFANIFTYSVDDVLNILSPRVELQAQENNGAGLLSRIGLADNFVGEHLTFGEKRRVIVQVMGAKDLDGLLEAIVETMLAQRNTNGAESKSKLKDELKNYRFRTFHLVSDLLRDKRGVPIPREILEIIVKCMLRDIPGAYYSRDGERGFLSEQSYRAADQIYKDVSDLLGQAEYQAGDAFPESLRENLLFKLRALSISAATELANHA